MALAVTGCGSSRPDRAPAAPKGPPPAAALRVGVVGSLTVHVKGARVDHGSLAQVAADRLVVVSAAAVGPAELAAVADGHPATRFALIGASTAGFRRPNVAGIVVREGQASRLAGVVAGLVAESESTQVPRVAWIGPEERALTRAFVRGVHTTAPRAVALRQSSRDVPVACKEAAITAIERGAVVLVAHGGRCAEATAAAAHEQNQVALAVTDFELPNVAADTIAGDAVGGVYYGGEDVLFGASSGVIGVRRLDPRIPAAVAVRARVAAQELAGTAQPSG